MGDSNKVMSTNNNGSSASQPILTPIDTQSSASVSNQTFDRKVILRQSPFWSRAIVVTIVGVTSAAIAWACLAKIEEAIPAQGKLEPKSAVKTVQAPVGGVVEKLHVEEGKHVEEGEILVTFEQKTAQDEYQALLKIRQKLEAENRFYRSQLQGVTTERPDNIRLSPEFLTLTENRAALVAENRYYQATLRGENSASNLNPRQLERFQADQTEFDSRAEATRLEADQLKQELNGIRLQLANARNILQDNQRILNRIAPLVEEGAIAELQYLRQEQEVGSAATEVNRLKEEEKRLQYSIIQAQERLRNTVATSDTDTYSNISENEKRIADIDSQLTKVILENEKRLEEVNSQISQINQTLIYQELRAPVSGKVFDLQPTGPGFVANSSDPLLKIVPQDNLIAKVYITNQDIGFVEENMTVDVRIDSFPYSEFGDIKGKLVQIGSDALPPNEIYPFYRFPAEIHLETQALNLAKGNQIQLQSGMSVNANIKLRKRRIITIFTDLFTRKVDSLKSSS